MRKRLFYLCVLVIGGMLLMVTGCATGGGKIDVKKIEANLQADYFVDGDWQEIPFDDFTVSNNVWNKKEIKDYVQYIYLLSEDDNFPFGWGWYWPEVDKRVKSYPEIIYGWKPWSGRSTVDTLPIMVKNIKQITVTYDITSTAKRDFNLSFDIWVTSEARPKPENITHEVMIWLDHQDLKAGGEYVETVTIGGEEYDFNAGNVSSGKWQYVAFVKKTPEYKGDTKINLFFDYLVKKKYVKPEYYLASIEFGNEVVAGTAETRFNDFKISVN